MNFADEKKYSDKKECRYIGVTCSLSNFVASFAMMFFPEKVRKKYIYYIFGNQDGKIPTNIKWNSTNKQEQIKYYLSIILSKALYNEKYENYEQLCIDFRKVYWDYVLEIAERPKYKNIEHSYMRSMVKNTKESAWNYKFNYPVQLEGLLLLLLHDMFDIPILRWGSTALFNAYIFPNEEESLDPQRLLQDVDNLDQIPILYIIMFNYNLNRGLHESITYYDYQFTLQSIFLSYGMSSISLILCNNTWYIVDVNRAQKNRLPILPINNKLHLWKGYKTPSGTVFNFNNIPQIRFCYILEKKNM